MSTLPRQGAWAVLDQVLSSGTNFIPALLLARALGPESFGAFSLAFLAWFSALALMRSALMQPYMLAASPLGSRERRGVTRRAAGAVLLAGFGFGALFVVVAVAVGVSSTLGHGFLAIAALAPGLALQEFWRVAAFASSRAHSAVVNDGCWALGQIAAFGALAVYGQATVGWSLLAWGAGGCVAAGVGMLQFHVVPGMNVAAVRWARQWATVGVWFTAATLSFTIGTLAIAVILAGQIGSASLGLFRAVQNLFGPVQLLTIGAESVFLPHLVRVLTVDDDSGIQRSWRYSLLMGSAVATYGLLLVALGGRVLTTVFGADFAPAASLVFPTLLAFVLDAIASGAALQLRAKAFGSRLALVAVVAAVTRVAAVALFAAVGGLQAAVWGLVVGSAIGALAMWAQVYLAAATRPSAGDLLFWNNTGETRFADAEQVL